MARLGRGDERWRREMVGGGGERLWRGRHLSAAARAAFTGTTYGPKGVNIRGVVPVVFVAVFGAYGQTRLSKKCILAIRCARSLLVTDPVRSERPGARVPRPVLE